MERDYLVEYLTHTPIHHGMWRAIEGKFYLDAGLNEPILDIGCGDGLFASMFFKGKKLFGMDISYSEACRAKKRRVYKSVLLSDAPKLPFKDQSFSSVLSNCSLEHIENVKDVFYDVFRVLKQGGLFCFTVPTDLIGENFLFGDFLKKIGMRPIASFFSFVRKRIYKEYHNLSIDTWRNMVEKAGFEVVEYKGFFGKKIMGVWSILFFLEGWRVIFKYLFGRWYLFNIFREKQAKFFARFVRDIPRNEPVCVFFLCRKR
ncbi:TPA: hypothetical protein DCX16_02100 [bacterium]|nr:hypothetical protein [bacterium]